MRQHFRWIALHANGTPGGIREPAKLVMSAPRSWAKAPDPRVRRTSCDCLRKRHFAKTIGVEGTRPSTPYMAEVCWRAVCLGILDLEKPSDGRIEFEIREAERLAVARITWG